MWLNVWHSRTWRVGCRSFHGRDTVESPVFPFLEKKGIDENDVKNGKLVEGMEWMNGNFMESMENHGVNEKSMEWMKILLN